MVQNTTHKQSLRRIESYSEDTRKMAFKHTINGEHRIENMVLTGTISPEVVETIRGGFDLTGDVLLSGYPKTGTTWIQELLWLLVNDVNIEAAKTGSILDRSPMLEITFGTVRQLDLVKDIPHPRLVKSHLPARFFQKQLETDLKVVIIIRNPKDMLVSYFHFYRTATNLRLFPGTWDDFFELYKAKHLVYGDYFDWYQEWIPHLGQKNIKLVTYEDMVGNLRGVIGELAEFLGKSVSETQMNNLLEHLSFKRMRENDMVNHKTVPVFKQEISPFMRKGVVGDWKNYFSKEQSDIVDAAYRETLESAGIRLQFE